MGRQRRKLGNVYAIPLPNGEFAYCRQYEAPVIGISKFRSKEVVSNPDFSEIDFYVGVYNDVFKWRLAYCLQLPI